MLLPLRNTDELNATIEQIYDPTSPAYRQYLSYADLSGRFGPSQADYLAVINFAQANGLSIVDTSPARLAVYLSGTAAQAEAAFHVNLNLYQDTTGGRMFYAPDREPTVDLSVPLWHVGGLNNFAVPLPMYQMSAAGSPTPEGVGGSGPYGWFLASDKRVFYYNGANLTGSGQAVALFELDGYSLSDVQTYFSKAGQQLNVPINNVLLLGASAGSDGQDLEQVLDIVQSVSMAPGLSQVRVYIAPFSGFVAGVTDYKIFDQMYSDDTANQISVSWGWSTEDASTDEPVFELMVGRGQNIFVASGDQGAWVANKGYAVYPAEDPWVTAVGGTYLTTYPGYLERESESAWGGSNDSCSEPSVEGSGGGTSPDKLPIPSYQQISGVINSSNQGSTAYRNAPDLAAEANCDNYICANGGCTTQNGPAAGGTSYAAPTWAGFMALV